MTKLLATVPADHDSRKGIYTIHISEAIWPRIQEIIRRGSEIVAECDVEFEVREKPSPNVIDGMPAPEGPV